MDKCYINLISQNYFPLLAKLYGHREQRIIGVIIDAEAGCNWLELWKNVEECRLIGG
jgi:hypothetical protein